MLYSTPAVAGACAPIATSRGGGIIWRGERKGGEQENESWRIRLPPYVFQSQTTCIKSRQEGFPIVEHNNGSYLINITKFLLSDTFGITSNLMRNKQGSYKLDTGKSALYLQRTKAFPKNVEFEALLTFTGAAKGSYIRSVTPNSGRVTVRQHHSFIELPDENYEMRKFDTRSGAISGSYMDYATPNGGAPCDIG